ncbi:MAG: IclR family transcriptional regulator [Chloroflexota bacterium]
MTDYSISVLEDAFKVVELISDSAKPISLVELTRQSSLNKNKVFRILHTLEKHRYVERDEAHTYQLGARFITFSRNARQERSLIEASAPILDWLAQETSETIFLGILDGQQALCVDARESPRSIRLTAQVGQRTPLHVGSIPKVLLAFQSEAQQNALIEGLSFELYTNHTIRNRAILVESLQSIHDQGYAVTSDDLDEGACSVATPIFNRLGKIEAALSIAGPSNRFSEDCIAHYILLAQEGAECISQSLRG